MRYGMNPHKSARVVSEQNPLRPLSGEPSLINYPDSLNGWQLVRLARAKLQPPIAASFKHLSPAGVAVASGFDDEPGGSIRTSEISEAAAELGIQQAQTGVRLFLH